MSMKQKVAIKTRDTRVLFKIQGGTKSTLLDTAMYKISTLYNLARQRNVFAFLLLMQIHEDITKVHDDIQANIKRSKKLIKRRVKYLPDVSSLSQSECELDFSNPIQLFFIQLIQSFDNCISWFIMARINKVFAHQNGFYNLKGRIKKRIYKLLETLVHIRLKDFPQINFNNFFDNDEHYQKAVETHGEIDPQLLYNAIHSVVTPALTAEELNKATSQLKKMVVGG